MSYCRFNNTVADLIDCEAALVNGDELSEAETKARDRLLRACWRIATNYCDEDTGNPDPNALGA